MAEYDDLIKEFGSKGKGGSAPVVTPHADLIKEFGSGTIKVEAPPVPTQTVQQTYNPDGTPNPPVYFEPQGTKTLPIAKQSVLDKDYGTAVGEDFREAQNQFSKGINEIATNRSAQGVGNAVMGVANMALSPVTPLIKGTGEVIDKALPGNPQGIGAGTGEKALLALPIKGTGNFVKAKLPSNIAISNLIDAIGVENLPEVVRRMKANERISPIDASNSALQVAQKLAVTEGPHQNKLSAFSQGRVGVADDVVRQAFDDALGVPVNALENINKMKEKARETGRTSINPIVEKSGPADITDTVAYLEREFGTDPVAKQTLKQIKAGEPIQGPNISEYQRRLLEERQSLRGEWTDKPGEKVLIDVKGEQGLHEKQIALRREAQDLIDSQNPADRRLGDRLMTIRNQYVDAIDKASPGYKEGLAKYADDIEVQEAFERGFSLFNKSPKVTNRPEFLEADLKNMKSDAIEAMKEGGRIAVDSMTRTYKNAARKGQDITASEFNAEKLRALYGKEEANKLIRALEDERAIATSDTKLYQNSQTAMRLKNDNRIPQQIDPNETNLNRLLPLAVEGVSLMSTGVPGIGAAGYFATKGVNKYAVTPAINRYYAKQNEALTDLITATGEDRQQLIRILEDRIAGPKSTMQQIKHFALPLARP